MKAQIKTTANGYTLLSFYNSSTIYSVQGFDTKRKATNYAKKFGITLTETKPAKLEIVYGD